MAVELGSVALQTPGTRRSTRSGHGSNGRDAQLDRLGDMLVAPTRQAQKCFAPSDGLSLPNNVFAPVRKKCQQTKKVHSKILIYCPTLMVQKTTLPPPIASQPCQQLLPNIDPHLGFFPPHPPSTPLYCSPPQLSTTVSPVHLPPIFTPPLNTHLDPDLNGSDSEGSDTDGGQNREPSINERLDDEDDLAAHELLCAVPMVAQNPTNNPAVLPYDHQGFAVS